MSVEHFCQALSFTEYKRAISDSLKIASFVYIIWSKKFELNTSLNGFKTRPKDDGTREYYNEVTGEWVNFSSGAEPVVLWTNPAPTIAFPAQTINVNYSDYDYILLEFKLINDSYPTYITMTKTTQKNVRISARMTDYPITNWYDRIFKLLDNAISFEGGAPSDGYGIPFKIYGCNAMTVPAKTEILSVGNYSSLTPMDMTTTEDYDRIYIVSSNKPAVSGHTEIIVTNGMRQYDDCPKGTVITGNSTYWCIMGVTV